MFRLLNRPPAWLSEADLADLRQAAEEFSTAVNDAGALTERLKLLQEELSALVSEHSNRTLFILTVVTVLALPINLVAGLLGMNVGGIPLAQHPQGFSVIVAALTVVTGMLSFCYNPGHLRAGRKLESDPHAPGELAERIRPSPRGRPSGPLVCPGLV
jgi:zinc transporter